jgi:KaiC/GvpD/RAD55 family RecA-like ATPase
VPPSDGPGPERETRVSTGNPGLDRMLSGGLLRGRPYLFVGPAGSGKTKLALEFLCEGVRRGDEVLLVTLEEPPNEIRFNHRGLSPDLDRVYVFDAIPDVMRYERTPFKDIAAVRDSVRFADVPRAIRKTPELSSVEVTFSALEQTLKMQAARRSFTRLVVDSLTALQYFCMKGIDEVVGAQSFLRFLTDVGVTTVLTVESGVEDAETAEGLLARGEIRLFRWEHQGRTVRAIGVEKFRGSSHDIRLHPYRVTGRGLDINLDVTISRDTHRVLESIPSVVVTGGVAPEPVPAPEPEPVPIADVAAVEAIEREIDELATAGIDLAPVLEALEAAIVAAAESDDEAAFGQYRKAETLVRQMHLALRVARAQADPASVGEDLARTLESDPDAGLAVPSSGALFPIVQRLAARVAVSTGRRGPYAPSEPPRPPGTRSPAAEAGAGPAAVAAERPRAPGAGVLSRVASAFGRAPPVAATLPAPPPVAVAPSSEPPPLPPAAGSGDPAPSPSAQPIGPAASGVATAPMPPAPPAATPPVAAPDFTRIALHPPTAEAAGAPAPAVPLAVGEKPRRRRRGLLGRSRKTVLPAPIAVAAPITPIEDESPPPERRPAPRRRRAPRVTAVQPGPPPPEGHGVPVPAQETDPASPAPPLPAETLDASPAAREPASPENEADERERRRALVTPPPAS